jgi:hypothetical protein
MCLSRRAEESCELLSSFFSEALLIADDFRILRQLAQWKCRRIWNVGEVSWCANGKKAFSSLGQQEDAWAQKRKTVFHRFADDLTLPRAETVRR